MQLEAKRVWEMQLRPELWVRQRPACFSSNWLFALGRGWLAIPVCGFLDQAFAVGDGQCKYNKDYPS
jgi:hypothetical protein